MSAENHQVGPEASQGVVLDATTYVVCGEREELDVLSRIDRLGNTWEFLFLLLEFLFLWGQGLGQKRGFSPSDRGLSGRDGNELPSEA